MESDMSAPSARARTPHQKRTDSRWIPSRAVRRNRAPPLVDSLCCRGPTGEPRLVAVTWRRIRRRRVEWPAGVRVPAGAAAGQVPRSAAACRRYGGRSPQISRSVASAERPAARVSGVAGGDRHRIAIWLPWREAQPRQAARPAVPPIANRRAGARCASGRGDAREGPRGGVAARGSRSAGGRSRIDAKMISARFAAGRSEGAPGGRRDAAGGPLKYFSVDSDRGLRSARRHGRKIAWSDFTIEF